MDIEVLQEWGLMCVVPEEQVEEFREILPNYAVTLLLAERPSAIPVSADYRVRIPIIETDYCPDGHVVCGVLVRFREPE